MPDHAPQPQCRTPPALSGSSAKNCVERREIFAGEIFFSNNILFHEAGEEELIQAQAVPCCRQTEDEVGAPWVDLDSVGSRRTEHRRGHPPARHRKLDKRPVHDPGRPPLDLNLAKSSSFGREIQPLRRQTSDLGLGMSEKEMKGGKGDERAEDRE